jgi:hypothetical protein
MNNLRVVYDNAANRLASLTASTTNGSLAASNLLTDIKSEVWRSTSTSATLTLTWATAQFASMVALCLCSLTSQSTIRVRAYTNTGDANPAVDTGAVYGCRASPFDTFGWGVNPLGVNSYSYGGGAYGVVYFTQAAYQKIVVDIVDTTNPLGYIEASRLVCGAYWTPDVQADAGASLGVADSSRQLRSDAGDLRTDRGTLHKTISFSLGLMSASDRNYLWNILKGNGMYRPLFISLLPSADDYNDEQQYQLYGKLSKQTTIKYMLTNQFSTTVDLEEI